MGLEYVSLGVTHIGKAYLKGAFAAHYYKDGNVKKSKTVSLSIYEREVAFEACELWGQDVAKEMGVEYRPVTYAEICLRLDSGSTYGTSNASKEVVRQKKALSNSRQQASIYKNPLWFNACLDQAIIENGVDKVTQVLQKGLKIASEYKANAAKIEKKNAEAKHLTAVSLLNVFKKTGIEMIASIDDVEVKTIYYNLKQKDQGIPPQ